MIVAVVRGVKRHFALRLQEWVNCFILLTCGLTLMRPGFSFRTSESYDVMASMATESIWAAGILVVAGLRLVALVLNGTFDRFKRASPYVRSCTACLSVCAWSSLGFGILLANPNAMGGGICMGLAIGDLLLCGLIADEAADAERARRGRTPRPESP